MPNPKMRRNLFRAAAIAVPFALACFFLVGQSAPKRYDFAKVFPKDTQAYFEFTNIQESWRVTLDKTRQGLTPAEVTKADGEREKACKELFTLLSDEVGLDLRDVLKEVDSVHCGFLGMRWKDDDVSGADFAAAVGTVSPGYFMDNFAKQFKQIISSDFECKGVKAYRLTKGLEDGAIPRTSGEEPFFAEGILAAPVKGGVIFATSQAILEGMLDRFQKDGGDDSLAANADLGNLRKSAGTGAESVWFVQLRRILDDTEKNMSRGATKDYQRVDSMMGFTGIRMLCGYSRFDSQSANSSTKIVFEKTPEIYGLIRQKPRKLETLSILPEDTALAIGISIEDPAKWWTSVKSFITEKEKVFVEDRQRGSAFEEALDEVAGDMGVSVDEIMAQLGEETFAFLRLPKVEEPSESDFFAGVGIVFRLKDPAKAQDVIGRLRESKVFSREVGGFEVQNYKGYEMWVGKEIEGRGQTPPVNHVVVGNCFVCACIPDTLKAVIDAATTGKSLGASKDFTGSMRGLPQETSKLAYLNVGLTLDMFAKMMKRSGEAVGSPLCRSKSGNAIALATIESDREIELVTGSGLSWTMQMFTSIAGMAIPEIVAERRNAMRWSCVNNLRQIGTLIALYENNTGEVPASLDAVLENLPEVAKPEVFKCPADRNPKKSASGLETSYEYWPRTGADANGGLIVAYDREVFHGAIHGEVTRNVLFGDGMANSIPEETFLTTVGSQLKARGETTGKAIEELNAKIAETKDDNARAELQTTKGRLEEEKKLIETRLTEFDKKLEELKQQEKEAQDTPDDGNEK